MYGSCVVAVFVTGAAVVQGGRELGDQHEQAIHLSSVR